MFLFTFIPVVCLYMLNLIGIIIFLLRKDVLVVKLYVWPSFFFNVK